MLRFEIGLFVRLAKEITTRATYFFYLMLQNKIYKPLQRNIDHVNKISIKSFTIIIPYKHFTIIKKTRTSIFHKKNPNHQDSLHEENSITILGF